MKLPPVQMKAILAGMTLLTSTGRSAIVFTDIPDIGFYSVGNLLTQPIDLNFDGVDDVVFRNYGQEMAAFSTSTSAIAGISTIPPDQNHSAAPFESGSIIGSSFTSLYTWNEGYSGLIGVRLIGMDTSILGLWINEGAYLGVEFKVGEATHYGWVQVDTPFLAGGGIIKAFAYEGEAGVPIVAGAIPEPSGVMLIGTGSIFLLARRKRPTR